MTKSGGSECSKVTKKWWPFFGTKRCGKTACADRRWPLAAGCSKLRSMIERRAASAGCRRRACTRGRRPLLADRQQFQRPLTPRKARTSPFTAGERVYSRFICTSPFLLARCLQGISGTAETMVHLAKNLSENSPPTTHISIIVY